MTSPIRLAGKTVTLRGKPLTARGVRRLGHLLHAEVVQTAAFWLNWRGERHAQEKSFRRCRTAEDYYTFSGATFGLDQVKDEILSFLDFAQSAAPVRVCEIGTQQGAPTYSSARPCHPSP